MKVLQFICSTGFYGAERWILALCKHLPTDVENHLVVTDEPETQDLELERHFKAIGPTHRVAMAHKFDIGVVNRLAALIREQGIDIIHTHGYKSDIIGVWAAKKANTPCVVTPHGFENASDIKLRAFIWLGCQAMKKAEKVVPLSPALMQDTIRIGVAPEKRVYIQNGVDLSEVESVRDNAAINADKPKKRIGFIGQMISRKNIKALLDSFETLAKSRNDVELLLLGDGDERAELESYTTNLSCKADIQFLGFRDDRLELLKSFDIFVMTSTLEGIPRCLMEACAMGIPVVAFDIPGVDQLIKHKETGLLAPLNDNKRLVELFNQALDDNELSAELGNNAISFVEQHFSAKRMAKEYNDLFNKMMNGE